MVLEFLDCASRRTPKGMQTFTSVKCFISLSSVFRASKLLSSHEVLLCNVKQRLVALQLAVFDFFFSVGATF